MGRIIVFSEIVEMEGYCLFFRDCRDGGLLFGFQRL